MKPEQIKRLADGIVAAIKSHVEHEVTPLRDQFHALEARVMMQQQQIAELERKVADESKAAPDSGGLRRVV